MWSDIQDKYLKDIKLHTMCSNGASWAKQVIKLIWQQFFIYGHNAMKSVMERTNKALKSIIAKFSSQKLRLCTCSKTDFWQEIGISCSQCH
eukprot:6768608-Ditylum_brightwellii.AAC.1